MKIKNNFKKIVEILKKDDNFLITSHINLDGDAIGSELALNFILKKLNKKSIILNQDKLPKVYHFLPGSDKVYNLKENEFDKKEIRTLESVIGNDLYTNAKRLEAEIVKDYYAEKELEKELSAVEEKSTLESILKK